MPDPAERARLAAEVLAPFGWSRDRLQLCMDTCEQRHAPRSVARFGLEAKLVRRTDLVDVTRGLVRFGLDRGWLRDLFAEIPRDGFWRQTIGPALVAELRHRPGTLGGVFVRPRRTLAPERDGTSPS